MTKLRIPAISNEVAERAWNQKAQEQEVICTEEEIDYLEDYDAGPEASSYSDLEAAELFDELEKVRAEFEFVSSRTTTLIDGAIVEPIHRHLSEHATLRQLSNNGFWRWLSNVALGGKFWDFIMWRFNSRNHDNWSITNKDVLIEGYLSRSWLRGQLMFDEDDPDPYKYAKRASTELWRSQILRQDFGKDIEFVKAFIDVVYDEENKPKISTEPLRKKLIPAIRAWSSSASFINLSYEESRDLLEGFVEKMH